MKNNKIFFLSILFYTLSIIITAIDNSFYYRWLTFSIWFMAIGAGILFCAKESHSRLNLKIFKKGGFLFILVVVFLLSFSFLKSYPFVSIYDQVRDGGLNAREIFDGTIKNIFSYGRYGSHGLIIPTISSFFYLFFKDSVLTFRFPAAIIASLDAVALYFAVKKNSKNSAFWASLILISLPLHLYYGRTELVVIFSSFFVSLTLLLLSSLLSRRSLFIYVALGLILGFSSGFHTSIRTFSLLTLAIVIILDFKRIKNLEKGVLLEILTLFIFYFVGLGPRILFSSPMVFFQVSSLNTSVNHFSLLRDVTTIGKNYFTSFFVYSIFPTVSTHYPDFKPILTPILSVLFYFGLLNGLFFTKNKFLKIVAAFSLILPFTNSAITNILNADNRLLPLLPLAAVMTGSGFELSISWLKKIIKNQKIILFVKFSFTAYLLYLSVNFFVSETASKNYNFQDYLNMHGIYLIKDAPNFKSANICFFVSKNRFDNIKVWYNLFTTEEQFQYFLPEKTIYFVEKDDVGNNEIFISRDCNENIDKNLYLKISYCAKEEKFVCDPKQKISLFTYLGKKQNNNKIVNFSTSFIRISPKPRFIP